MNTTAQTMTANHGTPLHCRHLELGACTTAGGRIRKACEGDVEASFDTAGSARILWNATGAWGFADAQSLAAAARADYALQGRATRAALLGSVVSR